MTDDANKPKNINKVSSPTNQIYYKKKYNQRNKNNQREIYRCKQNIQDGVEQNSTYDHPVFIVKQDTNFKSPKARTEKHSLIVYKHEVVHVFVILFCCDYFGSLYRTISSFIYVIEPSLDIFLFFPFIVSFPQNFGCIC